MTYRELVSLMKENGIEDADYEASILVSHFFGISRASLPFLKDKDLCGESFAEAVRKRTTEHYPLQYLIGEWDFCNEKYYVGEGCLIPRPETEFMVLKAAELLPKNSTFLELGTGSGCITVSLLRRRTDLTAIALDISNDALEYARKNAERNGTLDRVTFIHGDMLSPSTPETVLDNNGKRFGAVLSNPPYIPTEQIKGLAPELFFEPDTALDGGADGLDFYRALMNYANCVENGGFMLFEAGYDQESGLRKLCFDNGLPFTPIYDISGNFRNVLIDL